MKDHPINYIANGCGVIFSAIQQNEVLSWISWGLTLLATLVSLAFTLWKWWKKAKQDGKIDDGEIQEGIDIIHDHTEQLGGGKHGKRQD